MGWACSKGIQQQNPKQILERNLGGRKIAGTPQKRQKAKCGRMP
jgi:hypothetical protein